MSEGKQKSAKQTKSQDLLWMSFPGWQKSGGSVTDSSYQRWKENDRELKRTRCPACDARHFWTRPDRKELQKKGEVRIDCQCGEYYWVVINKDGRGTHIRANRRER